jgi:alkylation response protein AidB-like acyl-CoA dehydrogenase
MLRLDLHDAVRRVGVEADRRSAEAEVIRRLPDDLAASLVDLGLFRAWVAKRYGGWELPLTPVLDAIEELSWHDGATGWCAMIGATSSLACGYLDPAWATEIYGPHRAVTGGYAMPAVPARPVEGGLMVSGRWQWGSFSHHCTWLGGGCFIVDAAGKRAAREDGVAFPFVFFERSQVTLLDTWRVSGLRGTGSTDYQVTDAFVPEGRWVEFLGRDPVIDSPLYRFPFIGALALGVCSVALGLARRAYDELVALAGGKRPAQSNRTLAERAVVQAQVAEAEAAYRSARALVREVVAEAWVAATEGGPLAPEHRRLIRLAATNATQRSAYAVDLMYHVAGGSAIHESSPLQRVWRDVNVVTQHGMVAARTFEPVGRMALGLPTDPSQL